MFDLQLILTVFCSTNAIIVVLKTNYYISVNRVVLAFSGGIQGLVVVVKGLDKINCVRSLHIYNDKYVCVCVCVRTICPVVRKDKRKLIKKFLIRIFPLCIGFCLCVVCRKLIIGSLFFSSLSGFRGYDVSVVFRKIVYIHSPAYNISRYYICEYNIYSVHIYIRIRS